MGRKTTRRPPPTPSEAEALLEPAWQLWESCWKNEPAAGARLVHWIARSPENLKAFMLIAMLAGEECRSPDLPRHDQ